MVTSGSTSSAPPRAVPPARRGAQHDHRGDRPRPGDATRAIACDADYRDPLAAKGLARSPFRVVHRWTEQGKPRSHVETITKLPAKYTIRTGSAPEMVSVAYEMAVQP